ncbi:MAG: translesion error-prone DNA polymerase V autoproteolytic subunit [Waddliaceae bacterium]
MQVVEIHLASLSPEDRAIPAFLSRVQAGFPSPAEDYMENRLDLNDLVIQHPAATFFVRVEGESMADANIHSGDILVVDRALEASNGKIVVAVINGEFTVKRFTINSGGAYLVPENPRYPTLKIEPDSDFHVWGVVTYVIHKAR